MATTAPKNPPPGRQGTVNGDFTVEDLLQRLELRGHAAIAAFFREGSMKKGAAKLGQPKMPTVYWSSVTSTASFDALELEMRRALNVGR